MKIISFVEKVIPILFYILLFFVPIILWPKTSEVFEFNKMILTYLLTVLISSAWAIKMILQKKFIFRRTILDVPLLIFLGTQALSTLTSIDFRTSLLGYYSRFNGGLLSTISYALLYWAYVSNMDRGKTLKSLYILLGSAVLVSVYGVLEHFGIDKDLWVQDVQNRVFSTLGQPNWLAAWLVALFPLSWSNAITNYQLPITNFRKNKKFYLYIGLSALFFLTLLYTKSRSGLLGFAFAFVIFWIGILYIRRKHIKTLLKPFGLITSSLLLITFLVGTPWTPNLNSLLRQPSTINSQQSIIQGPALETGGTESGEIRKIVWRGAVEIWKHYPLLGTGPETFAFAYYMFRPVEHNLVSEWDFLYNKAHNEYLNVLATTGILGLVSYLILIVFAVIQTGQFTIYNLQFTNKFKFENFKNENSMTNRRFDISKLNFVIKIENYYLRIALVAGYVSILVSNFFGFSVVPTAIEFFLFPAIAITLVDGSKQYVVWETTKKIPNVQKVLLLSVLLATSYLLLATIRYWYADVLFAMGRFLDDRQKFVEARKDLSGAVALSPNEAIFYSELSQSDVGIALALDNAGEKDKSRSFIDAAISESNMATTLSPANLNLKRNKTTVYIKLATADPKYLKDARDVLLEATAKAPTDAKLFYNLGLTYARMGDMENAIATLKKTIELKPNYRDARLAYALILIDKGQVSLAREQLLYILEKINPNDSLAKQQLEEIK